MKILNILAVCTCMAAANQIGWAQQSNEHATPGILGHLDPKSGAFTPLAQNRSEDPDVVASVAPSTGKIVTSFTVTVASALPATTPVECTVDASVIELSTGHTVEEVAAVTATRAGTSATCTVTLPYSWNLTTPASDTVSLSYSISAGTSTGIGVIRLSSQSIGTIRVPANGSTTSEVVHATI